MTSRGYADEVEILKRDLRLSLESKAQADRLVETLTKRCDVLRTKLLSERESAADAQSALSTALAKEREIREGHETALSQYEARIKTLESEVAIERRRAEEYRKVADAALLEASHILSESLMRV